MRISLWVGINFGKFLELRHHFFLAAAFHGRFGRLTNQSGAIFQLEKREILVAFSTPQFRVAFFCGDNSWRVIASVATRSDGVCLVDDGVGNV